MSKCHVQSTTNPISATQSMQPFERRVSYIRKPLNACSSIRFSNSVFFRRQWGKAALKPRLLIPADRCVRLSFTHQAATSPSSPITNTASKLLLPQSDLESTPRRTMHWKPSRCPRKRVHEIGFQLRHVNRDWLHTSDCHPLQVRRNKHVPLLMFMGLEPRGAPIGRSRGRASQSKRASISGKLLLIYLASSEIIRFSGKSFSLLVSPGKREKNPPKPNSNFFSFSVLYALCQ